MTIAMADELAQASTLPVSFVADERKVRVSRSFRDVVSVTVPACEELGLYCPDDFAWTCGDYGYHLARQQYPEAERFWMIEYDVRFSGRACEFFDFFCDRDADFLAAFLREAEPYWYWSASVRARGLRPYRCLFPVTRLSARAIDAVREKRVQQSRRSLRRRLWPNDEAMVATTLCNGDFSCRDFNGFGPTFYDPSSFSFTEPIDGDAFDFDGPTRIHHPVLYGERYHAKVSRLKAAEVEIPKSEQRSRRMSARLNRLTAW